MDDTVKVMLIANAGVLLEYRGIKIILDGIFHAACHKESPFCNIPASVWQDIMDDKAPFSGISCLLFTHEHEDHFLPDLTVDYLSKRPIQMVCLPPDVTGAQAGLRAYLQRAGISYLSLETVPGGQPLSVSEDVTVTPYPTRHIDKTFAHTPHYCFLITFGDKRILFTSDADYTLETFPELQNVQLCAVFVNPLFFGALQSRRFFRGEFHTEKVCVYHVPTTQYRELLRQSMARWSPSRGQLILFERSGQEVLL